jgi:Tfp pilus assembly protein PilW
MSSQLNEIHWASSERRHATTVARRRRSGVGLVELLVALAICAALLTAVAVATDASFKAYGANQTQAQLTHRARLAMNRITTYIRATDRHLPDDDTAQAAFENTGIGEAQASSIRMMVTDTTGVIFRQANNQLQMIPFTIVGTDLVEGTPRKLLDGVGAGDFLIDFQAQRSAKAAKVGGVNDQLKRASITLTVRPTTGTTVKGEDTSDQSVTISTAITPRRNVW